jgi:GTPase
MNTKAGYVTIIGKPNAGKSTLMNQLLGEKLSIITNKPQTTRKRVLGILTKEDCQIIFLDTPGILNPNYLLQEKMMEFVFRSIQDADIILMIIDITDDPDGNKTFKDEKISEILEKKNKKIILLLNKVDLSEEKDLNKLENMFREKSGIEDVIPVSALRGFNVDLLLNMLANKLPDHPKYYPDDQLTDEPERFFVSEIIREKILDIYKDEVPYSVEVGIEEFKERERGKDYISALIYVERESQKPIIIGKQGTTIKKLGEVARDAIEEFLQRQVYLELRVKVRSKWRSEEKYLKNFGYFPDHD